MYQDKSKPAIVWIPNKQWTDEEIEKIRRTVEERRKWEQEQMFLVRRTPFDPYL